ncbi:MAG: putative Pirin family protein [Candidatus Nomurabacteria bacterium]|nr:putative Pirin family protein [Candidatus Nomurabacteria bacterium]
MKINHIPGESRGKGDHEWLKSRFSFSFADYYDPSRMGFGPLRVINDDWIAPGSGFPPHSHRDMEIFTIPLSGKLHHKDNTGKESVIGPGEIQIMSAGTGVTHSEFNDSETEPLNLLQIWIEPSIRGISPRHEEKSFPFLNEKNKLHEIINPTGESNALKIQQGAYIYLGTWNKKEEIKFHMHGANNGLYIFVIEGMISVGEVAANKKDALEVTQAENISIRVSENTFLLIIEVPNV